MKFNQKKIIFLAIFILVGFLALQVPVNTLVGANVKFTLFDLIAPISGAFLGTGLGIVSVLAMQVINLLIHGIGSISIASMIRLVPTLAGVWFFAKKEGKLLILPAISIIAFNLHPIGRTVWFYSLFWTIPFIVYPFREKFLIARSLGATFTAHAVGGAIWIWVFNLPANVWISLIPVVVMERSIFALGMSASYLLMNNVLGYLSVKKLLPGGINVSKNYLLKLKA